MSWERVRCGAATVDCLSFADAVDQICLLAATSDARPYVVTPNIQHIALLRSDAVFARAYADAALVLPDGAPVVATLRALTGRRHERVTGADLLPALCRAAASRGLTVGFLGGSPGAATEAARRAVAANPALSVTLVEEAPYGFDQAQPSLDAVLDRVAACDPDVLFMGFGTPKQEKFVREHTGRLGTGVTLCVGAAIDFAAGYAVRAPESWQRWGVEWVWRVKQEPRRLAGRYANAAPRFVAAVLPDVTRSLRARARRSPRQASP